LDDVELSSNASTYSGWLEADAALGAKEWPMKSCKQDQTNRSIRNERGWPDLLEVARRVIVTANLAVMVHAGSARADQHRREGGSEGIGG